MNAVCWRSVPITDRLTLRYRLVTKYLNVTGVMDTSADVLNPACPSRTVLRHLTDRWTPLIVVSLTGQPRRFGELREAVGGISAKVLTETLRSMERDGLVSRRATPVIPPRVDYELTDLGRSLVDIYAELRRWAESHAATVLAHRDAYDEAREAGVPAST